VGAFDTDADLRGDVAFRLMSGSFVTLFWDPAILAETIAWLDGHGYRLVTVDASAWATDADLHRDLASALSFPDYYGANLDAFNDCLRDVADYDYGARRSDTGLVLVLIGYDAFAARRPATASAALDIFAGRARVAALTGHRMLCLVQSADPDIRLNPVGAAPVLWNPAAWLDATRHP
jgi:hypothetical protein